MTTVNTSPQSKNDTIASMARIIELAKANPGAELELRFGHMHDNRFVAGCSATAFHTMHNKLNANSTLERTQWIETQSCTHQSNVRVVHEQGIHPIVTKKRGLAHVIIPPVHGIAFKLSLATEDHQEEQPSSPAVFVRLRKRQQFFHGSKGQLTWAYDFTCTRSAKTQHEAQNSQTVYEIELELIDPEYLQQTHSNIIANSILHRVTELVKSAHIRSN